MIWLRNFLTLALLLPSFSFADDYVDLSKSKLVPDSPQQINAELASVDFALSSSYKQLAAHDGPYQVRVLFQGEPPAPPFVGHGKDFSEAAGYAAMICVKWYCEPSLLQASTNKLIAQLKSYPAEKMMEYIGSVMNHPEWVSENPKLSDEANKQISLQRIRDSHRGVTCNDQPKLKLALWYVCATGFQIEKPDVYHMEDLQLQEFLKNGGSRRN